MHLIMTRIGNRSTSRYRRLKVEERGGGGLTRSLDSPDDIVPWQMPNRLLQVLRIGRPASVVVFGRRWPWVRRLQRAPPLA